MANEEGEGGPEAGSCKYINMWPFGSFVDKCKKDISDSAAFSVLCAGAPSASAQRNALFVEAVSVGAQNLLGELPISANELLTTSIS